MVRSGSYKAIEAALGGQKAPTDRNVVSPVSRDSCASPNSEQKDIITSNPEIDLSALPSFVNFSTQKSEELKSRNEVAVTVIQMHLRECSTKKEKSATADTILRELEGLMKEKSQEKSDDANNIKYIKNTIKDFAIQQYGETKVTKYIGTIHMPPISSDSATQLPLIFEDFKNAFKSPLPAPNIIKTTPTKPKR